MEEKNKSNKKSGNKSVAPFFVWLLLALLGLSILLGIGGIYYKNAEIILGLKQLGNNEVVAGIECGESNVLSFLFLGSSMPGEKIRQKVGIKILPCETDVFLRSKVQFRKDVGDVDIVDAKFSGKWVLGSDKYYYYDGTLKGGQTTDLIEELSLPKVFEKNHEDKILSVEIIIESIKKNGISIEIVWENAPAGWALKNNA
ncbi:MAG: hypothetical protein RR400_01650 [Clostridia bacterium]